MEQKLLNEIRNHNVSPQAAAWLTKALHPPSLATKVAIPDASWRPGLRVDARPSMIITAPNSTDGWDLLIVTPPGDNTFMIAVGAPLGTDFSSTISPSGYYVRVLQVAKPEDYVVNTYAATSVSLTVTPTTAVAAANVDSAQSAYDAQAFRTTYRSITVSMTASELYNGGTLTAGQYDAAYVDTGVLAETSNIASNDAVVHQCLTNLPLSESTMTQGMPLVRTCAAKEGYYMPHRLLGPNQPFLPASTAYGKQLTLTTPSSYNIVNLITPTVSGVNETMDSIARAVTFASGSSSVPFWASDFFDVSETTAAPLWDIGYDNCATGVAIFRNLDPHATLTAQGYVGFEYVLRQNSPFLNFIEESANFDARALQLYYDLVTRMPMVYPSDHNDFGRLLGKLYGTLKSVAGVVGPVLVPAAELAARYAVAHAAEAPLALTTVARRRDKPKAQTLTQRAVRVRNQRSKAQGNTQPPRRRR